jgi:aryl-alcohol dehydrogenase-like predicted oxidoreductase
MQHKRLGWTGLELSRIGLGTWAMGGGDWEWSWGAQDDERSIETIHAALDLGINWIDTAAVYGLGHSEEVVGRAIAGMAERPIIATKCSQVWGEDGRIHHSLKADSVVREAEASLRRLGLDVIDVYQIHWPDPRDEIEEGWRAIVSLIESGKIRYGGVSNFNPQQMSSLQAHGRIASLQPPYSMLRRGIESETLGYCAQEDIGVIVYSPMERGLLTGKVTPDWVASLPEDDHRKAGHQFRSPELEANMALAQGLAELAGQTDHSAAQLAIAWTLARPEVTGAIVGARRSDQIESTAAAADWALDARTLQAIDSLLQTRLAALA